MPPTPVTEISQALPSSIQVSSRTCIRYILKGAIARYCNFKRSSKIKVPILNLIRRQVPVLNQGRSSVDLVGQGRNPAMEDIAQGFTDSSTCNPAATSYTEPEFLRSTASEYPLRIAVTAFRDILLDRCPSHLWLRGTARIDISACDQCARLRSCRQSCSLGANVIRARHRHLL